MRKLVLSILVLMLSFRLVQADDASQLTKIYQSVLDEYVDPITVEDFAVLALKSINKIDSRILVADDKGRVTLYAQGRVVKVLNKPENTDDVAAWVKVTQGVIKEACKVSPKLSKRDFEIVDFIMTDAFPKLDHASIYYNGFTSDDDTLKKAKRYYSDRMIDDILYIRVGAVNKYTKDNILKTLKSTGEFKGVILDLRGNPGGLLKEAIDVTNLFLDEGIIASTRGRSSDSVSYYMAEPGDILNNKPIVVLIDGATASSAEVMAAALKEQSRAKIVGTRSYGKGTVQKLIPLENDSRLALTDAYFFTPSGEKIDKVGILPDVCTFQTDGRNNEKRIIDKSFMDCPAEKRENTSIDIDVAVELINKKL